MRRRLVLALPVLAGPAAAQDELVAALRAGGVAVLLRHASTDPGIGDPPGFRPGVCATQRNLSADGRAEAARIGAWFRTRGLAPAAVRSSAWCRCLDTARLAFGQVRPWPALDSFFGDAAAEPARTLSLRSGLADLRPGRFEVWVTHMVNITRLSGEPAAMGEALVLRADPAAARGVALVGRLAAAR